MAPSISRVGLDVGGVFVKVVVLDSEGRVTHRVARRHQGNPVSVVGEEFRRLNIEGPVAVGITGAYAHLVAGGLNLVPVDLVNAEIKAVRRQFPGVRNVINVGGSSVTLIQLDQAGNFMDYSANSLCAAGTGSFLDQQADRLGIKIKESSTCICFTAECTAPKVPPQLTTSKSPSGVPSTSCKGIKSAIFSTFAFR